MDQHSIQLVGRTGMLRISASFFQPDMLLTGDDIMLDHIIGFQVDGMDGHENGIIDGIGMVGIIGMDGIIDGMDGIIIGEPDIIEDIGMDDIIDIGLKVEALYQAGMFFEVNSQGIIGLKHSADIIGFIIMVDSIAKCSGLKFEKKKERKAAEKVLLARC
jgi:hypothetical protein